MSKKNRVIQFWLAPKKKVRLHFNGPFVAKATIFGIQIDEYFEKLELPVQQAIIWHEKYHMKNSTGFLKFWWFIRTGLNNQKSMWIEEFNADQYSALRCGKENVLKFLKKAKELYKKRIVEYHENTHPPINERIRRIQELKI
jgi:hypothetical protein